MVQRRFVLYAVAFAMAFLVMGTSAWADIVPVTVTVNIWRVAGNLGNAPSSAPAGTPNLIITGESNVNFSTNGVNNPGTLQGFLDYGGHSGSYNSTPTILGQVMSDVATYQTVIEVTGSFNFLAGTTYTINHDDGAVMFAGGNFATPVINSPGPTVDIGSTWTPGANTSGQFEIFYMATNGNPEVLQLTAPDGGMTLMLLGGALVGLETLRRKFRV